MIEILPFGSVQSCPKCGCKSLGTEYCRGTYPCHLYSISLVNDPKDWPPYDEREHLHRQCLNCRYRWYETTKQQEDSPAMRDKRELLRSCTSG